MSGLTNRKMYTAFSRGKKRSIRASMNPKATARKALTSKHNAADRLERGGHGAGVGWESNLSTNGFVVNGNNVTAYGLFVEHHQEFQVLWNGNSGRTYFYQSEIPYDPPDQASYTSAEGVNGWASYKVADSVTSHEAWGLGIYSVFRHPSVKLTRAIEVPPRPNVRFHSMITVALDDKGEISNVINNAGGPTSIKPRVTPRLTSFP